MRQAETAEFRRHGGRIDAARRHYPHAPRPWIDLSTGINPNPWTPPEVLIVDAAPLPGLTALRGLEATAARRFGVAAERVVAVPGSEIALRLLPALGLPPPIVAVRPGYGTHGVIADGQVEAGAIGRVGGGTLLLAIPNNPDGSVPDRAALDRLLVRGGGLVIDEAFADAMPDGGVLPLLAEDSRAVVLRSFGKFFGLAGVRLGFVIGSPVIVGRMRELLGDWPVNAQAIAWGTAAYADDAWIAATRASLAHAAARLDALLARHGLAAAGACPLFRLVEDERAPMLFERLASAGILTRPFADRRDWLRFGLPRDDAAFERLDWALAGG